MGKLSHIQQHDYRKTLNGVQRGGGFMDSIKAIFSTGKDVLFGDIGTTISNMMPDSDSNARPLYSGEIHSLLKLPNGKMGRANYMGPNTHIIERIRRGDIPRTYSDKESQAHDLRYGFATSNAEVRLADNKMIDVMKNAKAKGLDSIFNTTQGMKIIQAKTKLEDLTGKSFVSFGGIADGDKAIARAKLNELEQEGFGRHPAHNLRKKLLRQTKKMKGKRIKKMKGKGIGDVLSGGIGKLLLGLVKTYMNRHK